MAFQRLQGIGGTTGLKAAGTAHPGFQQQPVGVHQAHQAAARQRGRIVCNCLDVSEHEISAAIAGGDDLDALQRRLQCGSRCGSCVPELKRLVAMRKAA